jgi:hypothetical protein
MTKILYVELPPEQGLELALQVIGDYEQTRGSSSTWCLSEIHSHSCAAGGGRGRASPSVASSSARDRRRLIRQPLR